MTSKNKKKEKKDDGVTGILFLDLIIDCVFWVFRGFGKALEAIADLFD